MIFDRSWYNRAGVEYVMGFCSKAQHRRFLKVCPEFELYIVDDGIQLIKYWLEVSEPEQKRRFEARITDPVRQWKLSPTDLCSRSRWFEYSRARDMMLEATDTKFAPWYIVPSDDKRRARLNCIRHLLSLIPYKEVKRKKVKLPKRSKKDAYDDQERSKTSGSFPRSTSQTYLKFSVEYRVAKSEKRRLAQTPRTKNREHEIRNSKQFQMTKRESTKFEDEAETNSK